MKPELKKACWELREAMSLSQQAKNSFAEVHMDNALFILETLIEWLESEPRDQRTAHLNVAELEQGWLRYEAVRKLNARQFSDLCKRNMQGERFNDLVDELVKQAGL